MARALVGLGMVLGFFALIAALWLVILAVFLWSQGLATILLGAFILLIAGMVAGNGLPKKGVKK